MKKGFLLVAIWASFHLIGCGGGGAGTDKIPTVNTAEAFSIGGVVSGLGTGKTLVLTNNSGDSLTIVANGNFRFATGIPNSASYTVAVGTQPTGQTCTIESATGRVSSANINNLTVACSATYLAISGVVAGLDAGKSVILLNNGVNALPLNSNSTFSFSGAIAYGSSYAVTVGTQPTDQTCAVSNPTGINTTFNISNVNVLCHTLVAAVSTLAGSGVNGHDDGLGAAASFYYPIGVAVDSNGNVYVADNFNHNIRKVSAGGVVVTFAGYGRSGSDDGIGSQAGFNRPSGVAVDANGNVYVADTNNYKIRKITSSFVVTTLAGSGSMGTADGIGAAASFSSPYGIAVDVNGNVFVSDYGSNKIRKITSSGVVTTLAGSGSNSSADGIGAAASFSSPLSVAVDSNGNVYVADYGSSKIRKVTSSGVVTTLAGSVVGNSDGTGSSASFNWPSGVAVDSNGNVFVADSRNEKIRKITPLGEVTTVAGSGAVGSTDGTSAAASFAGPAGVAVDSYGNVYVADTDNSKIRKIIFQ